MSIEQLTSMEEQFTRHLQTVRNLSRNLSKSQTLRIGAWLKKLCSVVDNYFWRKNRNLYAQVLALMLTQGCLEAPFDKAPPQGSLSKLSLYQIPFSIRQKLECNKNRHEQKQNNLQLCNISLNKMQVPEINNLRSKKRQSFVLKTLKSMQENKQNFEEEPEFSNQYEHVQTQRRGIANYNSNNINNSKNQCEILTNTLQKMLYFMAKNNAQFIEDEQYMHLIQEIIEYGDQVGKNFRNLKFSYINQS